ncbi:MAG: PCRF domain-containing protein [Bacteroidaceae bacterium]|nr:PCRF domain-containing protein [Bacteroidaceae bacterium]
MNIEFDVYKQKLGEVKPGLEALADSLNLEGLRNELERLHAMQEAPGFWDNPEKSQKVVMKTKQTESKIENYEKMLSAWEDLMTICEMAAEEDDDSTQACEAEGEHAAGPRKGQTHRGRCYQWRSIGVWSQGGLSHSYERPRGRDYPRHRAGQAEGRIR